MKNGLKLTLMTAALAFGAMTAQATAPTIIGVPSTIIVGDAEGNTGTPTPLANDFVYPTDIDLLLSVSDDDPATNQIWSYKETGTQVYTINNAPAAASGATDTDLVSPASWLFTNSSATNDPADLTTYTYQHPHSDNAPKTITIRNTSLSPIGGPNVDPGAAGHVSGSDGVIELIVSDGTVVGAHKNITVYSVNDDVDSNTGRGTTVLNVPFTDATHGWIQVKEFGTAINGVRDDALGLCIDVGNTPSDQGDMHYDSAADIGFTTTSDNTTGWIDLVANAAYRVRTELSTTATASASANTQPMTLIQWTSKLTTWGGANLYLDNGGHANSVITGFRPIVDTWITPPGVLASPWTTGLPASGLGSLPEYTAGLAPGTDSTRYNLDIDLGASGVIHLGYVMNFKVFFRVYDRNGSINSDARNGMVCMKNILIERFSMSDMAVNSTVYDTNTFGGMKDGSTNADPTSTTALQGWKVADFQTNTSTNFAGNVLSLAPSTTVAGGWGTNALVTVRPGNGTEFTTDGTTFTTTGYASAEPIPWVTDQILIGRFYMSCGATPSDVGKSVDNILIGFDAPITAEIAGVSFMTGNVSRAITPNSGFDNATTQPFGPGMPKFDSDQWVVLYNTNTKTLANTLTFPAGPPLNGAPIYANADRLRPRVDLTVNATSTNGNATSTSSVRIQRVKVDVVSF